ncbi:MAG TPA: hypothetical protein VMV79_04210 [Alphaproteobacteria bacterium]|nr:hypothetical protein [Alphaproteobacteria bacterium]
MNTNNSSPVITIWQSIRALAERLKPEGLSETLRTAMQGAAADMGRAFGNGPRPQP